MELNKIILGIVVLIILSSMTFAAKPINVVFAGDTGLRVLSHPPRFLKSNSVGRTSTYIFNATNGVKLINSTLTPLECLGLIQHPNGSELAIVKGTQHLDHFDFSLNLTEINLLGEYGWVIFCNNSNQGGFLKGFFELTSDGYEPRDNSNNFLTITLFSILFLIMGIYIIYKGRERKDGQMDD